MSSHPPCCPQRNGEGQSLLSGSELISRISLVSELWFIRLVGEEMREQTWRERGVRKLTSFKHTKCIKLIITEFFFPYHYILM